jgi:hypothetical protein
VTSVHNFAEGIKLEREHWMLKSEIGSVLRVELYSALGRRSSDAILSNVYSCYEKNSGARGNISGGRPE